MNDPMKRPELRKPHIKPLRGGGWSVNDDARSHALSPSELLRYFRWAEMFGAPAAAREYFNGNFQDNHVPPTP